MGRPYKLVCQAERTSDGTVIGSVRPEQVPLDDPLARRDGATSIITFQMDVIHVLTLSEMHPDAATTAYGPLADFITIARGPQARGSRASAIREAPKKKNSPDGEFFVRGEPPTN